MTRGDVHVPWVVLPTFNEAENLEHIVAAIVAVLEPEAPTGFRVLVVDDDSPDGTGEIVDRLAATNPAIEVLHRSEARGAWARPSGASVTRRRGAPATSWRWTLTDR